MRGYPLIVLGLAFVSPALADKKLDPDPAFLAKARSAATAAVEPHYDLVSEKVPFWARFLICAGQLTAARDEGRALPIPKDDIDKLIADYRTRAADVIAYRQKADAKASALDVDSECQRADRLQSGPPGADLSEDVTRHVSESEVGAARSAPVG
jgi:hypothetical protein